MTNSGPKNFAGVKLHSVLIDAGDITHPEAAHREADLNWIKSWISVAGRCGAKNVRVIAGDVTRLPFPAGRFSAAACLTMLHHIPSPALQDAALAELARVLRPGGVLAGSDGLDTPARRELHVDDVFVPVDPGMLEGRLRAAGFGQARVDVAGDRVRFAATR